MIQLDERGKACPLPVIETKKALEGMKAGDVAEVLVDNEIAVQNLEKMCVQRGHQSRWERIAANCYLVRITKGSVSAGESVRETETEEECEVCQVGKTEKGLVAVLSSETMGNGDEVLGRALMKGFVYALTEQDRVPETVLMYNGGAKLSVEGADTLKDLKLLEEQGSQVLTCGTCLNHYGLTQRLAVGSVTNMYRIAEILCQARKVVRP